MTCDATAELEPDTAEVDVELVVDHHDVSGRHRVELGQRSNLAARLVHVAPRLGHKETEVVPSRGVSRPGVAEADHKLGAPPPRRAGGWFGHTELLRFRGGR